MTELGLQLQVKKVKYSTTTNTTINMEFNLSCSICLELYNDPIALQCIHNFCRACLVLHLNSRIPASTKDDTKVKYACPNCKKEYRLSRNDVRNMPRNFLLQNIVDSYKKNHGGQEEVMGCDLCKENNATKRCNKCEVAYCNGCLKTYHPPDRPPFSKHNVTDVGGAAAGAAAEASGGSGSSLNALQRGKSAETIKAQFKRELDHLKDEVKTVYEYLESLRERKQAVQKKGKELTDGISIEGRKLHDFINKTAGDQDGMITKEIQQNVGQIDQELRVHQDYFLKQEVLMDSVRVLLNEADVNAILRTAPSVKTKLDSMRENKPGMEQLSDVDWNHCTQVFQTFKQRVQGLMVEEKYSAPSKPPICAQLCVCHETVIAICVPALNDGSNSCEATQIDMYGYKYKKPTETDWQEDRVFTEQIIGEGCIQLESLDPASSYSISIRAHNPYGWSPWSNVVLVMTKESYTQSSDSPSDAPPLSTGHGAPKVNTSSTQVGTDSVTLHWIDAEDDEDSEADVVAYSQAVGAENWTYTVAQNCGNSFKISGLTPGSSYLFKVGSCGNKGFSDWSKKVKIKLGQKPAASNQPPLGLMQTPNLNSPSFTVDRPSAHPSLQVFGMTFTHPTNKNPGQSLSDNGFNGSSYSVFGNATFTRGIYCWRVTIHGTGSKVRIGIAKPSVARDKPLGTDKDAWVLVMDARSPILRTGSYVLHDNQKHKSGGDWIPFTRHIGVTLDYTEDRVSFVLYEGTPSAITKRTNHMFEFNTPPMLRPVFAIDEKTNGLKLEVTSDGGSIPTIPNCGRGGRNSKDYEQLNREMLQECVQQ